eukprot:CAMPEP_0180418968 /NCGR_PEP_ID=MMETSP1036_2-20121128/1842_1 /TAXON_ID=632150 /ORGANISM="Azadinium spinosum, Strain 3D9" /LENGTH=39 /DNA_ID= /DNA_START= /DNA_END= /DNA_ORIENTATION=
MIAGGGGEHCANENERAAGDVGPSLKLLTQEQRRQHEVH